ncbi:hypothetical protein CEXT_154301 [Caerostris extrusa]|uniref:Uncharacterized protein n=1 Tax=Caerostris extrusa TaxID=172846 RepID=A0AAV4X4K4_CAEEX|nr:hypothetical protein CEXT_154301 [Caerostris extrusa]
MRCTHGVLIESANNIPSCKEPTLSTVDPPAEFIEFGPKSWAGRPIGSPFIPRGAPRTANSLQSGPSSKRITSTPYVPARNTESPTAKKLFRKIAFSPDAQDSNAQNTPNVRKTRKSKKIPGS